MKTAIAFSMPTLLLGLAFKILLLFVCFLNSCCCKCVSRKPSVMSLFYSEQQASFSTKSCVWGDSNKPKNFLQYRIS